MNSISFPNRYVSSGSKTVAMPMSEVAGGYSASPVDMSASSDVNIGTSESSYSMAMISVDGG